MHRLFLIGYAALVGIGSSFVLQSNQGQTPPNTPQVSAPCDTQKLPEAVRKHMRQKFPGFRPTLPSDGDQFLQNIWREKFPNECPGILSGRFRSPTQTSYAVLLLGERPKSGQVLVVYDPIGHGLYRPTVLQKASGDQVLLKAPAGEYGYPGGDPNAKPPFATTIKAPMEGIILETPERGALLFFFARGKYQSMIISE